MERSVVLIKPDALQRGLVGKIIDRLEQKGLKVLAVKMINLTDELLEKWYAHHKDKPFFPGLKVYMKQAPVIAMLWEGREAVATIRKIVGITRARDAEAGTIRGDFAMSQQYNLVHASENSEIAKEEERIMFSPSEICSWDKADYKNIYIKEELE
ncbi:MAG: nucleoside-diphosphate kinase [Patescibacteria group bacterium]